MDTGGPLIELANCFITKMIFNKANSIKFLIPITSDQIFNRRGWFVIDQLIRILNLCKTNETEFINAIQPVITKVDSNPKDLESYDIDILKLNLQDMFDCYLEN